MQRKRKLTRNADNRFVSLIMPDTTIDAHRAKRAVDFCAFYTVNGAEYWDSNHGRNYHIDVVPSAAPPAAT